MSVPSNPTVTVVVTEALKRAGRTTPTATMVADAITHQFQEVKADIRMAAPCHESLKTEAYTTLVRGLREYDWPAEAHKIEYVQVVDGSIDAGWVDTAQAGTTSSITLQASEVLLSAGGAVKADASGVSITGTKVMSTAAAVNMIVGAMVKIN